jgi:hypothetical protein
VYDLALRGIPEGTVVKDGRDIVGEEEVFTYSNGSVVAFSNYFRFHLLYKRGGYWADTDLVCIKPLPFANQEYVFSSEPDLLYKTSNINSGLIKLPQGGEVAHTALRIQEEHKQAILDGTMKWGSGPATVRELVKQYGLEQYVLSWNVTCSCHHHHCVSFFNPRYKGSRQAITSLKHLPRETVAIHVWNGALSRKRMNKHLTHHKDSMYEQLKAKYKYKKKKKSRLPLSQAPSEPLVWLTALPVTAVLLIVVIALLHPFFKGR